MLNMRRRVASEIFDQPRPAAQVRSWQADLQRINRWFGGISTSQSMLQRVVAAANLSSISLLAVAAGSGHVETKIAKHMSSRGVRVDVTLLDRDPNHMGAFNGSGARRVSADALSLPFPSATFDAVACGLFLHHLEPDQIVRFTNEALRVCTIAVLINDLRRSPLHLLLAYAAAPLLSSRASWHDAVASVQRAYTPEELESTVRRSRASRIEISNHYLYRVGLILWK